MQSIIIFNYNYEKFLGKAINSCSSVFNNTEFNIFFLDDGSSDNSIQFIKNFVKDNSIYNIHIIENRKFNAPKREFPSHGQLTGLGKVFNDKFEMLGNYIFFLDADDYFKFNIKAFSDDNLSMNFYDVIYLKVVDFIVSKRLFKQQKIKRYADSGSKEMWPSIVPTSGIILKKSFITNNYENIFNLNPRFSDIWLDARINILSLGEELEIKYSNEKCVRLIHNDNDSLKGGLIRAFLKQLIALSYRDSIMHLKDCKKSLRYFVTKASLIVYQKIKG